MRDKKKYMALLCALGFLAGILYSNVAQNHLISEMGIFSDYFLSQYLQTDILVTDYLWYITKVRTIPMGILVILGCTRARKIASGAFLAWTGFACGMLMTAAVLKLGLKGLLLCVMALTPHIFFYAVSYLVVVIHFLRVPESAWNVSKTVSVVLFMLAGILLECYVNPAVMQWFVNIL